MLNIAALFAMAAAFGQQWSEKFRYGMRHGPAPRSRWFGRGGKYMPHQGKRECMRRRMGGFHALRRLENDNNKWLKERS